MSFSAMMRSRTRLARLAHKGNSVKQPPKPKLRKPIRPWARKNMVLAKIPGTMGILSMLAERVGCCLGTMSRWLNKPGWEHVKEAMEGERVRALEKMKTNVFHLAQYSLDDGVRLKASTFLLEKLDPDFAPKSKVQIEGGDKPVQHQHLHVVAPADVLKMPVEDREKMLDAMEAREAELLEVGFGD